MAFVNPTNQQFRTFFQRDFPFSINPVSGQGDDSDLNKVTDSDISVAIATTATFDINQDLFADQSSFTTAFLYFAAHQLCERLLMSAAGIQSQYSWLTTAKSVGDVSESFQIPPRVLEDPFMAAMSKTRYGVMFLRMMSPLMVGHTFAVPRVTLP